MRALLVVGVVISTLWVTCGLALASGEQLWAKTYAGQDGCGADANSAAVDASSGTVYVLARDGECLLSRALLSAYSPSGTRKWSVSSGQWTDRPVQVAVDPTSHDVVVASTRGQDLLLQAWSSAGVKLWGKTYGVANSEVDVDGLSVDGHNRVFVGGTVTVNGNGSTADFLTSAYTVTTGATLWHVRYDGTPHLADTAVGIAVDPGNSQLYVNGLSENGEREQLVTIAYNSATGAKKWGKRATEDYQDNVMGLAVDTSNHQIYSLTEPRDTAELDLHAYTSTGASAFHTTFGTGLEAQYVAADPVNHQVYVGGWESTGGGSNSQALVVAFTATGTERWLTTDTAGTAEVGRGMSIDPTNHHIYLVAIDEIGQKDRAATLGFTAAGATAWRASYVSPNPTYSLDMGAIAAQGSQVYVGGSEVPKSGDQADVLTIAYSA